MSTPGMKPKILKCGSHWAVDWWSGVTHHFPVWECCKTWDEALAVALKFVRWTKDRQVRACK